MQTVFFCYFNLCLLQDWHKNIMVVRYSLKARKPEQYEFYNKQNDKGYE